jgi:hypothetical protein
MFKAYARLNMYTLPVNGIQEVNGSISSISTMKKVSDHVGSLAFLLYEGVSTKLFDIMVGIVSNRVFITAKPAVTRAASAPQAESKNDCLSQRLGRYNCDFTFHAL